MWDWIKRISGVRPACGDEPVEVPMRAIVAAVVLGMLVGAATAPGQAGDIDGDAAQAARVSAEPTVAEPIPRS